jgi:hypothetical protein
MTVSALFHDGDLSDALRQQIERARRAVEELPELSFRDDDPKSIGTRIVQDHSAATIAITDGAISVQASDADIDRRNIPGLDWGFAGDSPTVRGTRVTYNVPFTGDATLFRLRPSHWTSVLPRAELTKNELHFFYEVASSQVAGTKGSFERDLAVTKQYVAWVNEEVMTFRDQLVASVAEAVNQRIARLNAAAEGLASLGLPVRNVRTLRFDALAVAEVSNAPENQRIPNEDSYDVALSFAGEDRQYVQQVAKTVVESGARVFFDEFETVSLWGKDLIEHLQNIYQNRARYCVIFVSKHYVNKPWPTHERRSAQARALVSSEEYLLPARFDDSVLPGLQPTIGYVDLRSLEPEDFAQMILQKVRPT